MAKKKPPIEEVKPPEETEVETNEETETGETEPETLIEETATKETKTVGRQPRAPIVPKVEEEEPEPEPEPEPEHVDPEREFVLADLYSNEFKDESKISWALSDAAPANIKSLAERTQKYIDIMSSDVIVEQKKTSGIVYSMFTLFRTSITKEDYATFKPLFAVINAYFRVYGKNYFRDVVLIGHATLWNNKSDRDRIGFNNLVTMLSTLCDPDERTNAKARISIARVFDRKTTGFSPVAITNVTKYYGL